MSEINMRVFRGQEGEGELVGETIESHFLWGREANPERPPKRKKV